MRAASRPVRQLARWRDSQAGVFRPRFGPPHR